MLARRLAGLSEGELQRRQKSADVALLNMGITFAVYGHQAGTEKIWPFDLIPRIIEADEWRKIDLGLKQRIRALNLFIDDLYHDRKIVRDGVFPEYMVHSSKCFLGRCHGVNPPRGIWCHITGTDLVRARRDVAVGERTATIELDLDPSKPFDRVVLSEPIELGQRVRRFRISLRAAEGAPWQPIAEGTTIGHKRIVRVPRAAGTALRVEVLDARAQPILGAVSVHGGPSQP